MVSLLLPVILSGNTAIVIPSERAPLPALLARQASGQAQGGSEIGLLLGRRPCRFLPGAGGQRPQQPFR